VARGRFPQATFIAADLARCRGSGSARSTWVILAEHPAEPGRRTIREVLRQVVQRHLAPGGAVILGLPNSRYVDGELAYGARMKNFRQPELGLLIKDVAFYRKYLQQHGRQVFVTGSTTCWSRRRGGEAGGPSATKGEITGSALAVP